MPATMGTSDRPRLPDETMLRLGPPELERVGRRGGFRPAIAAVAIVALLLGFAVWKPWEPGSAAVPRSSVPPDAAGGLLPAVTGRPGVSVAPAPTPTPRAPTFAGLDLSLMGTTDPHHAWGVAIGYVSQAQFDAAAHGAPIVTPAVGWELVDPARPWPAPTLDHPDVTTVAIAATWPSGIRPSGIRLVRFGDPSAVVLGRPSSGLLVGVDVPVGDRLVDVVGADTGASPLPGFGSGSFYTPAGLGSDVVAWPGLGWPASWPAHGWPAGVYAFEVDLGGTTQVTLPFVIAAGRAS
jgi:hypothetical protein